MSDVVAQAVAAMNEKLAGSGIDGTAQFNIEGEGSMVVDGDGAREGTADADVTFNADADTYREIFDGELNPTSAFMSGRLTIDGDMGMAMKLAASLDGRTAMASGESQWITGEAARADVHRQRAEAGAGVAITELEDKIRR